MLIWKGLYLLLLVDTVFGRKVFHFDQEKLTMTYVDDRFVDCFVEVYKFNQTANAVRGNMTFKFKIEDNVKYHAAVYRWVRNEYGLKFFELEDTARQFTAMEAFGIADLCSKYTKPQAVWPVTRGVTYVSAGWNPDASKFPPSIPSGRWKVVASLFFTNNTKLATVDWRVTTSYR